MDGIDPELVRTDQCADAFRRIFWAFPFFLDLRVGINGVTVDLLPDFIGWLLIASGLTAILELTPLMPKLRTLAYWLVFLSLFRFIEFPTKTSGLTGWGIVSFLLGLAGTILNLVLIWQLCGLVMQMALAVGETTISERAAFRRKLYVTYFFALLLVFVLAFAIPQILVLAFIVGLPVSIIVFCLMMGLMKSTENMCRGSSL